MKPESRRVSDLSELTPIERREHALRALVCDKTFERFLRGLPIRPLTRERIVRALRERGLAHLIPQTAGSDR